MTCKKGELSEKDIKKENADLSDSKLSDVSGGKALYVEPGKDDRFLSEKKEGDTLLEKEGSALLEKDGVFLNPRGGEEDGTFLSPNGKSESES